MGGKGVTQEPFDLDLGKKVGNLDFWEGGVGYSTTSDLDLGKKVGNFDFWEGGVGGWGQYSATSDLDLGKKFGNLDFGGVFCNFGFGLRKKSWKFGFGGVFCNFGFGLREKSVGNLDFWEGGGILQLRIWT